MMLSTTKKNRQSAVLAGLVLLLAAVSDSATAFVNLPPLEARPPQILQPVIPPSPTSTSLHLAPARARLKNNLEWRTPEDWQVEQWLKQYGEVSRFYRRDVFTAADWIRSRRHTRYFETVLNSWKSGLLRQISLEVGVLTYLSLVVVLYNKICANTVIFGQLKWPMLTLPLLPFNLATASLGLLLTFRTNVSYGRWNEARTAWGKTINDSRSLARMTCIWSTAYKVLPNHADLLQRFGDAVCAFSRTLMNRTLPQQEDETNFQLYCLTRLQAGNYGNRLLQAKHRPAAALSELTSLLTQFQFHPLHQVEMEKMVTELCSAMGACERIFTSPVPTFYPRHTTRFLAFWLFLLPLALYEQLGGGFLVVPVMAVLGAFMLGIEELATQMEEPFTILPLEKMCEKSIRVPVMEQVEQSIAMLKGRESSPIESAEVDFGKMPQDVVPLVNRDVNESIMEEKNGAGPTGQSYGSMESVNGENFGCDI